MAVDLHTHSRLSDGGVMPAEIVEMAIARRLTAIALTDHDLIDGLDEARRAAAGSIEFIPGVELSVQWRDRGMHTRSRAGNRRGRWRRWRTSSAGTGAF